jgi:mRNA interferase RelE/StbE
LTYHLQITRKAQKSLAEIPRDYQLTIREAIAALAENPLPQGCKKLIGRPAAWRLRVGVYRVIYEINQGQLSVLVVDLGHRRDIYR